MIFTEYVNGYIIIYANLSFLFFSHLKSHQEKLNFWKKLNEPKFVVAPMVDYSLLPWRLLCRRHGAQLCYTPMLNSEKFAYSRQYREKYFPEHPDDRPLIAQFSANNPEILLKAAKYVEGKCEAIDLNFGCPKGEAKQKHFGAFLEDDWQLISKMVKTLSENMTTPITCKIRIFKDIEKSVAYAKMFEISGCQLITVHGRTRQQIGPKIGLASWSHIRAIREAVRIPVFANGNIRTLDDVYHCLEETGSNGVMSGEGILYNPALFEGTNFTVWEAALEYLKLVKLYGSPPSIIRNHLFRLFIHIFAIRQNIDLRIEMARTQDVNNFIEIVLKIKDRYQAVYLQQNNWINNQTTDSSGFPPWICHSWTVNQSNVDTNKTKENINHHLESKENEKSLGKMSRVYTCVNCENRGCLQCLRGMCKKCCHEICSKELLNCSAHGIIKLKRKKNLAL